jgi:hypothetical protein
MGETITFRAKMMPEFDTLEEAVAWAQEAVRQGRSNRVELTEVAKGTLRALVYREEGEIKVSYF